jgi:CelD/BcsL family acetyltransferase involved in cellulose biosynthesis
MTVEWIEDPTAFVSRDWTGLVEADPEGTFFHTPRYLKLYWEEFGAPGLHIALVHLGADPVAAAAMDVHDDVATWLGGFEVTDYMGPVGLPGSTEAAAKELMAALAGRDDWTTADLAGLPGGGRWLTALSEAAPAAGLECRTADDGVSLELALSGSFDDYLARLPGKLRHEMRRKDRRLREAFPDVHLADASPVTVARDLDRFVQLHRSSGGEKGRFMVPGMELFFRRLADELLDEGTFRLAFLEAGGVKVAGAVGFRFGERFLLYNSAYDHGQARLSPGMVLVAELIHGAIDEGLRTFDLLKGDLGYKYRFGARPRRIARLRLRRR